MREPLVRETNSSGDAAGMSRASRMMYGTQVFQTILAGGGELVCAGTTALFLEGMRSLNCLPSETISRARERMTGSSMRIWRSPGRRSRI